jgi:peptide/nickel transport system ATP-binding protein/oligopeptide transport system ATP-binding protein
VALLEVRELTTSFPSERGRVPVVDGVSFEIRAGEVLALVGESGSGKSVSAFSVMRLVPKPGHVDRGKVVFGGRDLLTLSVPEMRAVRGHSISMIFQEPMTCLNPVLRVGDQVVEAIQLHEPVSRAAARARTLELFKKVGIPDPQERLDAYPHQLSGGLKQRVMIAMALSAQPKLLIADEPTTALDVTIQAQILELLRELQRDFGSAILLITHDLGVVNELADRIAVMYAGAIAEQGTREEVLGAPSHPYTQGLLRAMPALVKRGERLNEIPGVVPRPSDWPKGCHFCTRCPRAFEPCPDITPSETVLSPTHSVYCHAVARDLKGSPS